MHPWGSTDADVSSAASSELLAVFDTNISSDSDTSSEASPPDCKVLDGDAGYSTNDDSDSGCSSDATGVFGRLFLKLSCVTAAIWGISRNR